MVREVSRVGPVRVWTWVRRGAFWGGTSTLRRAILPWREARLSGFHPIPCWGLEE